MGDRGVSNECVHEQDTVDLCSLSLNESEGPKHFTLIRMYVTQSTGLSCVHCSHVCGLSCVFRAF